MAKKTAENNKPAPAGMHTRSKSVAANKKEAPKSSNNVSKKGKSTTGSKLSHTSTSKAAPVVPNAAHNTTSKKRSLSAQSTSKSSKSSGTSAKQKGAKKAEPPFPLYRDASNVDVSEGMESIVNLLRGRKNIVVLSGAGISVSCGIPDFRSRGSGLYSTLDTEDLGLSCPEELFDWEVFREDPRPFYKFARNLYFPLGSGENAQRVRPSDSHKLLAMLEQKKMLLRVYTQNIDGLEQVAGVSQNKMVYAHGSLQWASCLKCNRKVTAKEIEPSILRRAVPYCQATKQGRGASAASSSKRPASPAAPPQLQLPSRTRKRPRGETADIDVQPIEGEGKPNTCGGVLKPGVTFFGEALNDTVRKSLEADRKKVDALVVIGTSLSVAPMSKVIEYLPANIPRILINKTVVHPKTSNSEHEGKDGNDGDGDFRNNYVFDAYLLGYCDDVTRLIAKKLFATDSDSKSNKQTHCQLLASVRARDAAKKNEGDDTAAMDDDGDKDDELEAHKAEDWRFCTVPEERVVLFAGADPAKGSGYGDDGEEDDNNSDVTFREVAHCDGCSNVIRGVIRKCLECFDYDLCQKCYPKLSKTHYDGKHTFAAEPAAVVP